jgi:tRNA 2-thiocytidine biosynthesis protein TtcA
MFYAGSLKTMPPKLVSDDGRNIVIRPLAYCKEADIKAYSQAQAFPIIPCNLCGSQPNLQRQAMKQLLNEWERDFPGRLSSMMSALGKVSPSHLLDRNLYDFTGIQTQDQPVEDGDTLFDAPQIPTPVSTSTQSVIPIWKK